MMTSILNWTTMTPLGTSRLRRLNPPNVRRSPLRRSTSPALRRSWLKTPRRRPTFRLADRRAQRASLPAPRLSQTEQRATISSRSLHRKNRLGPHATRLLALVAGFIDFSALESERRPLRLSPSCFLKTCLSFSGHIHRPLQFRSKRALTHWRPRREQTLRLAIQATVILISQSFPAACIPEVSKGSYREFDPHLRSSRSPERMRSS